MKKATIVQDAQSIVTSTFGGINLRDVGRGLIIMVLYTGLTAIQAALGSDQGWSAVHWNEVLLDVTKAGVAYIVLNVLTPAKVMITNPPQALVDTVKQAKKDDKQISLKVTVPDKDGDGIPDDVDDHDDSVDTSHGPFNVNPK